MNDQEWICVRCSLERASCFCFCAGQEAFLCEKCWPEHYSKNAKLVHLALPVRAYGQHRTPGYFDRLHSRNLHLGLAKTELLKNLEVVDACIADLTAEVQKVINAVWKYGELQLAQLQQARAELSAEVNGALEEAERTMYDDSPVLQHSLARVVREYNGDLRTMKLVDYRIDSSAVLSCIQSMSSFTCSLSGATSSSIADHTIAGISGNRLRVYDIASDSSQEFTLTQSFTDGICTCVLPIGALLCIGGRPASIQSAIIDLKTSEIQLSQPMKLPRMNAGLVCVGNFAYAFGSLIEESSCERLDLTQREWRRLPNMRYGRDTFSPSHLDGAIYLVSTRQPIEVYSIASNAFNLLNVKWTGRMNDCSSLFIDGELYIFTDLDEMGRWKPGDKEISISRCQNNGTVGYSQCKPVRYQRKAFFISWDTGMVNVFDLDTKIRIRKR